LELKSRSGSESESDDGHSGKDDSDQETNASDKEGGDSDTMDVDEGEEEEEEAVTEELLMMQIKKLDDDLKRMDNKIGGFNTAKREGKHSIIKLKQDIQVLEKEKNAFLCVEEERGEFTAAVGDAVG
jgi:hypothetical protein